MSYEERGTWVYLVVSAGVYAIYVVVVLSQASVPITDTLYQVPLLWAIGVAVGAAIVVRVIVEIGAGIARGVGDEDGSRTGVRTERRAADLYRADARDREIDRLGTLRTWWVLAAAALVALVMALIEWPYFWIANIIYLGFVVQAISSAIVKLVAYRRGF